MKQSERGRSVGIIKLKTGQSLAGFLFALPSLAGFALFFAVPSVISLYYCFTDGIGAMRFVGLSNFASLLQSGSFLLSVKNTLIFNAVSVPLIILLSFVFALLLQGGIKGLSYFRSFFILPLVIPVASVILVWQIMFDEYGVLNRMLSGFGAPDVAWMRSGWSMAVLVLVYLWKNCGYNVILFLAGINSIPKDYYESARIEGAGPFSCILRITIPFLVPTAFFVFVISVLNSFKVFREAYLLAGSYPDIHIYMLQHFMNNNFLNLSYPRLTTAAFLMAGIIAVFVFVLFRIEARFGRNL